MDKIELKDYEVFFEGGSRAFTGSSVQVAASSFEKAGFKVLGVLEVPFRDEYFEVSHEVTSRVTRNNP